ncbi:MAG: phenylalanine--tRNA ligase subunit alpha [Candidatus Aenigmarchaeota archaeon]|nr:phenylalanine--tRNA ligase subunit alpha [Candidatus Aenigmarchaeota archaeon]
MYILTEEGRKYLEQGLPEKRLLELLKKGKTTLPEAQKRIAEFSIALLWAKKNGWVAVSKNEIELTKGPENFPEQEALEKIDKNEGVPENILLVLLTRKLIEEERDDMKKKAERFVGKEITNLTEELIKTGLWKKATFREYNVSVPGKRIYPGKRHVLSYYIERIRKIFLDLGFQEASGPFVESSFWNFDALYQPQDHPARDLADTFYMKNPKETALPEKRLVDEVAKTHENGGITKSSGWGYRWNPAMAKSAILRTHTTVVSARMLTKIEPPAKVFCIGRVFRNETIDYKHGAEFTQIEGIVVDENVGFRDLLGYLKEFYIRMGFKKIRFRPSYFPYTEMSVEPEVYFEEKGEWLELGGAGIFRPEVTVPLGIDVPVLAWGLSLERPIMLRLALNDIRNFYYKNDLEILRNIKLW